MVKRSSFERVRAGLLANRDGTLEERARLRTIHEAIMTLPEAVRPMAQRLMFSTKMTAEEIIAAARCAPGGDGPSSDNQRLGALGRAEASRLLGKVEDPNLNFDPVEPNIFVSDLDSDLAKAGAATARALKDAGFLRNTVTSPGRMA